MAENRKVEAAGLAVRRRDEDGRTKGRRAEIMLKEKWTQASCTSFWMQIQRMDQLRAGLTKPRTRGNS